jgi:hypothetical protein
MKVFSTHWDYQLVPATTHLFVVHTSPLRLWCLSPQVFAYLEVEVNLPYRLETIFTVSPSHFMFFANT